ncbi:MAG: carbon-nitrogen hydrolase family protein [Solirubrobacteraceae bacterium]
MRRALILACLASAALPAFAQAQCDGASPRLSLDPRGHAPRVFAMQFKQEPANVVSLGAFRRAIDCRLRRYVLPHLARGRPNVVVFDEDTGLMTIATGARGAAARSMLRPGAQIAGCEGQAFPCATLKALGALDRAYARPLSYYAKRFHGAGGLGRSFVAATDIFVRGFMQTLSALARHYGLYIVASNTQAPFRLSRSPRDIRALAAPELPRPREGVYVATSSAAYNQTFIWGPRDVRGSGPPPLRNLVHVNRKVPLTAFESALGFAPGPATGPAAIANLRPFTIPGTQAKLGIATSLPAFVYGTAAPGHECDDVTKTYMRCLSRLGANVLIQADANDGAWTGPDADPAEQWQPLSWMGSAWRAVTDPSVGFAYAVNPFLVGNLADTPFDGQSSILQRGLTGRGCSYVGNTSWISGEDRLDLQASAGPKSEFLVLAPWVAPDAPRAALRGVSSGLAFHSASAAENRYLQTALIADLPFPRDAKRRPCQ